GAFEKRVDGEAASFDALDLDDLINLAGEEPLLAVLVRGRAGTVDDDVDFAQPVERLLGGDVCPGGEGEAGEVAQAVVGGFAVDAGHAGVAGREGPEHRHRFRAAALADDDPARIEPKRTRHELVEADAGKPIGAVGAGFVGDAVVEKIGEFQFGAGFADNDAFGAGDGAAERVEQGGLAGGDRAGDDDVLAGAHAGGEEVARVLAQDAELDKFAERVRAEAKAADGEDDVAVGAHGRDRGGEAGAVGEAGFDQRRDPVEAFAFDVFE